MSQFSFVENGEAPGSGGMVISQPERGYRFTSDTLALAEFVRIEPWESLLDFGTGVAVIPLLVWQRTPFRFAVGVELQPELVELARANVGANSLSERIFILQGDLRSLTPENLSLRTQTFAAPRFDVVTANPPYLSPGRGRINPNSQRAVARHEIELTFSQLSSACQRFLKPGGRFYFVHLAERETDILANLRACHFTILCRQCIGGTGRKKLFLAEARLEPYDAHCS
jgi:tRNA1Val (adenine37-N6)-methyltransferase